MLSIKLQNTLPLFFELLEIAHKHFLIRPTQFAEIEKNDLPKWPNDPFLGLRRPLTPKIEVLEKKVCAIKYSYTPKEQIM